VQILPNLALQISLQASPATPEALLRAITHAIENFIHLLPRNVIIEFESVILKMRKKISR